MDSNKSLFAELDKEIKRKIDFLYSMVDETKKPEPAELEIISERK